MRAQESIKMTDLTARCKYQNKKRTKKLPYTVEGCSQRNICCFEFIFTVIDYMAG